MKELKYFVADKVTRLDMTVWLLVLCFFCGSALIMGGDIQKSFLGAAGVIVIMFLIGTSIEMIIEVIKNVKGIGTIVGFITNGPELICLLVGLFITKDVLFAASTPLGSNFMNPVLLIVAALWTKNAILTIKTEPKYTILTVGTTASLAVLFYVLPEELYWHWCFVAFFTTLAFFMNRPEEDHKNGDEKEEVAFHKILIIPAILLLFVAGYFLDPTVSFAAEYSKAPTGVIGFIVLSTLTSWPEFKSSLALFNKGNVLAAILNITVSNITNIWLALAGIVYYITMN